ncbi:MAG: hypothetical protein V3R81_04350 [Gammaproteobacteria bacterium]
MSKLDVEIDGTSIMELNVLAVATAYDALELSTKVVDENNDRPKWLFGRRALNNNIGPPRITWVPNSGPIDSPLNIGGKLENGGTTVKGSSIVDRVLGFDVYCNGRSYEETENMVVSVISATRNALGVGTDFGDETWLTEQEGGSDNALNKIEAVLGVSIRMPVLKESGPVTIITTQTHTEILDPDLDC